MALQKKDEAKDYKEDSSDEEDVLSEGEEIDIKPEFDGKIIDVSCSCRWKWL